MRVAFHIYSCKAWRRMYTSIKRVRLYIDGHVTVAGTSCLSCAEMVKSAELRVHNHEPPNYLPGWEKWVPVIKRE